MPPISFSIELSRAVETQTLTEQKLKSISDLKMGSQGPFWCIQPHSRFCEWTLDPNPVIAIPLNGDGPSTPTDLTATITTFQRSDTGGGWTVYSRLPSLTPVVKTGNRKTSDDKYLDYHATWMSYAYIILPPMLIRDAGHDYFLHATIRCTRGDPDWVNKYKDGFDLASQYFYIHRVPTGDEGPGQIAPASEWLRQDWLNDTNPRMGRLVELTQATGNINEHWIVDGSTKLPTVTTNWDS